MREIKYEKMVEPYGQSYAPYAKWAKALEITKAYMERYPTRKMDIRYLYYRGVAKEILRFAKSTYELFIDAITRARKDFRNPAYRVFRERLIDGSREKHEEGFYREDTSEEAIKRYLERAFVFSHRLDPWNKRVEIWFESNTSFLMYSDVPRKYRLSSFSLHGNLTFNVVQDTYNRLMDEKRPIVILYVGDLNPSGERRPHNIKTALADLGVDVTVYKVLVNPEHVKRYNLIPSIETYGKRLEKARRDPNCKWFELLRGDLYHVDTAAMEIEQVEELLEKAIKRVLDVSKLDEIKKRETRRIPVKVERVKRGYRIRLLD